MPVVGGLLAGEPLDSRLGGGDRPGGIDRRGLAVVQLFVELASFARDPCRVSAASGADPVEVAAGVVDARLSAAARIPSGHGELAVGLVELDDVGRAVDRRGRSWWAAIS